MRDITKCVKGNELLETGVGVTDGEEGNTDMLM